MKTLLLGLTGLAFTVLFAMSVLAGEDPKVAPKVEPALTPNAEVLKQLDALGDNSSCNLGDPVNAQ